MELKVKQNSFWARYEGRTTCDVNSSYLVKVVIGLFVLSVLVGLGYFMVTSFWTFLACFAGGMLGLGVVLLWGYFAEQAIDLVGSALVFIFTRKSVKAFFYYGFYLLWKPAQILFLKIDSSLMQMATKSKEKEKARRIWDDSSPSVEPRVKQLARKERKRENGRARDNFWDHHTRGFLTHCTLIGLILGGLYFNLAAPGPRNIWWFGVSLVVTLVIAWVLVVVVMYLLINFSLPAMTRLSSKLEQNTLYKVCHDAYHFMCRRLVVEYKVFGDIPMRRAYSNVEAIRLLQDGEARLVLSSNVMKNNESASNWFVFCKNDDLKTQQILKEMFESEGRKQLFPEPERNLFCISLWREFSFEQLRRKVQNVPVAD